MEIVKLDGSDDLYCRYSGQLAPQPCYIELDCRPDVAQLLAAYNPEIGNATPFYVHHRHAIRWNIPALRADVANALLEDLAPLAERVVAGYETHWNGHNTVARYSEDARAAMREIENYLHAQDYSDEEECNVWDAAEYFGPLGGARDQAQELGITASSTDEDLKVIADRELDEAGDNGITGIDGLTSHLEYLRDKCHAA